MLTAVVLHISVRRQHAANLQVTSLLEMMKLQEVKNKESLVHLFPHPVDHLGVI
jgi:hypothetical protein